MGKIELEKLVGEKLRGFFSESPSEKSEVELNIDSVSGNIFGGNGKNGAYSFDLIGKVIDNSVVVTRIIQLPIQEGKTLAEYKINSYTGKIIFDNISGYMLIGATNPTWRLDSVKD